MAFPTTPQLNEVYVSERGIVFLWDGDKWVTTNNGGPIFARGATGPAPDVPYFQNEIGAPFLLGIDSEGYVLVGGSSFLTQKSRESWQYTKLGNLVTITGYMQFDQNPNLTGDLALLFGTFNDLPAPKFNGYSVTDIDTIDQPATQCMFNNLIVPADGPTEHYARVLNENRRLRMSGDSSDVSAYLYEDNGPDIGGGMVKMQAEKVQSDSILDVTVRYFTDERVYEDIQI